MSDIVHFGMAHSCAGITGSDIADDTYMALLEKKPRVRAAQLAADALLYDMADSSKESNMAELTAFVERLIFLLVDEGGVEKL